MIRRQLRVASLSLGSALLLRLAAAGVAGLVMGAVFLMGVKEATAYNTCWHPLGYCGSHYYSYVSFYDGTGFSGSNATAISNSGASWSSGYVGVSQSVIGPVNAYVGYTNINVPQAPARTDAYFNPSDPYEITYNEIYLNSFYTWYTNGTMHQWSPSQQWAYADVRTVTVHEMGHMLGLAHSCTSSAAVMCVTWTAKWSPATDDWNGINALY